MLSLIQAYCLVRSDVAFRCTHQANAATKTKTDAVRTKGGLALKQAITQLFGSKQVRRRELQWVCAQKRGRKQQIFGPPSDVKRELTIEYWGLGGNAGGAGPTRNRQD